jgi:hypothetical protein
MHYIFNIFFYLGPFYIDKIFWPIIMFKIYHNINKANIDKNVILV